MKKAVVVTRILFGLLFFVFGLNGFLQFMPTPMPSPAGGAFLGALGAAGYMFPMIKIIEILAGLALLSNRCVPFALVLIAPVLVNIIMYHAFLDPKGLALPIVLLLLHVFTAYNYREYYKSLFACKADI
jgi:uncharacterized membrane protein YphA (DoxX/SURF4 family)